MLFPCYSLPLISPFRSSPKMNVNGRNDLEIDFLELDDLCLAVFVVTKWKFSRQWCPPALANNVFRFYNIVFCFESGRVLLLMRVFLNSLELRLLC